MKALSWYRKAAEQEDPRGLFCMARAYDYGLGVQQDAKEAVRWYERAAQAGSAPAMCDLGVCYERGEGVEQDIDHAAALYRNWETRRDSVIWVFAMRPAGVWSRAGKRR